jgi:hypothetical protein
MHQLRHNTALRQLADLDHDDPGPSGWRWAICRIEAQGRLRLPAAARAALDATGGTSTRVRSISGGVALVLRLDGTGGGVTVTVDGRGRLRLPVWLRQAAPEGLVVVGTRDDPAGVVVASTRVLDGLGELLVGERG